jgi:lysophospholipase L1-like esterase
MMRNWGLVILVVAFLVGNLNSSALAESKQGRKNTPVYYLSLGTSLAAGVQADPATGNSILTDKGYPDQLAAILTQDIRKLRHVNLGCPGETAESFIYGGICENPHGSQLDEAVHFLKTHGKFTGLITIDLGANDVLGCLDGTEIDLECLNATLTQLFLDLVYIIEALREAAPGIPIVAMNYYNPLLVYWYQSPAIAQFTADLQAQINNVLESAYALYGVPVADVAEAFMANDLTTDANANDVPDSLDLICAWTWMCSHQNIHANDTGYAVIAETFYSVLPELPVSIPPQKHAWWRYRP